MRKYKLRKQTILKAKSLGVEVKPSEKKGKKIDVLRNNEVVSIGDINYKDYHMYSESDKDLAESRRRAYHARHDCSNAKKGTAGYYACKLLW